MHAAAIAEGHSERSYTLLMLDGYTPSQCLELFTCALQHCTVAHCRHSTLNMVTVVVRRMSLKAVPLSPTLVQPPRELLQLS